jgi:hypothetical protein
MALSTEEEETLKRGFAELVILYRRTKRFIFASEKISGDNRLSAPAINELRNAFEHTMRVSAVMYASIETGPTESGLTPCQYCERNLDKAMGHVYRAAYDALDIGLYLLFETAR